MTLSWFTCSSRWRADEGGCPRLRSLGYARVDHGVCVRVRISVFGIQASMWGPICLTRHAGMHVVG